jgi:hypothetical protein
MALAIASTGRAADSPPPELLDFTNAIVVVPDRLSGRETKAVAMLVEEVEKRTAVRWNVVHAWPREGSAVVAVGPVAALRELTGPRIAGFSEARQAKGEGYEIQTEPQGPAVIVAGNDARGVLFGVGRLLRELRMRPGRIVLPKGFQITTAPRYPLRGHQLGYRPKTNSYDGWDLDQWEQYIRDLATFGANAVELIPPRSDDAADSPHFPRPPLVMMEGMARLLDQYGLDVWLWYPAMDPDYTNPATVDSALKEWADVFGHLSRVDAVFVPGGDPGHTRPRVLFDLLEKATGQLQRFHPKARMWVSPQGFNQVWLDEFFELLKDEPSWLAGVVFGPQVRISLPELRSRVPKRYPLRRYPDITHSLQCQYPVPDWDLAFALTEGREVINPRPLGQANIFRIYEDQAIGFLTYSEGCNDDVNKAVWSSLGWDPTAPVSEILRQYSRFFLGDGYTDSFAQGLFALERNWQGPLLTNGSVETTLAQFQVMERTASPRTLANWRFQQALYRAYFDVYVRDRLILETALETRAKAELRQAGEQGSCVAMERATSILNDAVTHRVSTDRRARVHELAEALFQSIHMQLSVPRYKAISVDRGANLDTIDVPLNDRLWLLEEFAKVRSLDREAERLKAIESLVRRSDPGPGGFYDSLGDLTRQPHLVRGPGFEADPAFLRSSLVGFGHRQAWPMAWCRNGQSLVDAPLQMRYEGLDTQAQYRLRVIYAGDSFRTQIRLLADDIEIHPLMTKPDPVRPVEFDIPIQATHDGQLTLSWTREPGRGGNGRGCEVSEVWLMKK